MATLGTPTGLLQYAPGVQASGMDSTLQLVLDRVEAQIASYLGFPEATVAAGYTLVSSTYVIYLDGPDCLDGRRILLHPTPVASVTSIYDDTNWSYGSDTLVASGDYTLDDMGRVWINPTASHAWSSSARAIKATIVCGWTAASEDDPALLEAIYRQSGRVLSGWRQAGATSIQAGSTNKSQSLPVLGDDVKELLRPYRTRGHWLQ